MVVPSLSVVDLRAGEAAATISTSTIRDNDYTPNSFC
jgi:hypothetical protein